MIRTPPPRVLPVLCRSNNRDAASCSHPVQCTPSEINQAEQFRGQPANSWDATATKTQPQDSSNIYNSTAEISESLRYYILRIYLYSTI